MSTVLREQGIVTVHDQVVSWVAGEFSRQHDAMDG